MDFSFFDVFIVIGIILLMVIPGFIIKKLKMVTSAAVGPLAVILLYVSQPFLTIKAFALSDVNPTKEIIINMAIMFGLAFLVHLIGFIILKLVYIKHQNRLKAGSYMICSLFSNASFIGIPFVDLLTGNQEAVIYASVFMCAFNILIWTLGIYLITGDIKKMHPLKGIFNPPVFVLVLALPLFFIPEINFLKGVKMFGEGVSFFANSTLPLSMMIVGIRMADIPLRSLFNQWSLYLVSAFKLVIIPLVAMLILLPFLLCNAFSKTDTNNYIILVIMMQICMPTAASGIAMSERFNGDSDAAVHGFILSTLLSLITVPVMLSLLLMIMNN